MLQTAGREKVNSHVRILVRDLRVGMHVAELGRPWLGTPFMSRSFRIESDDQIEMLKQCCDYVFVSDIGLLPDTGMADADNRDGGNLLDIIRAVSERGGDSARYQDTTSVEVELESAQKIFTDSLRLVGDIFDHAESAGSVDLPRIRGIANEIVDSVLRNPDAFLLLQGLQTRDHYRYRHAVSCCSLAAAFCRFLGFKRVEIQNIAMGAMLLDIGAVRLPNKVLDLSIPLSPLLQKLTRHHVMFGLDMLRGADGIPSVIIDMIRTHHERMDGKGYPDGLQGEQIPVCGQIAAIVDSYDAMVNERPYRSGLLPTQAISELYMWREVDYHPELVEKFIQCLGAWPTGSLVELTSGQIGIVLSQNRTHRLYPRVLLVMGADRARYEKPQTLDLWECCRKAHGKVLDIRGVVQPGDVDIDPANYCPHTGVPT